MTEQGDRSNNGNGSFRRYPPAGAGFQDNGQGSSTPGVTPFQRPRDPGRTQAERSARRRWRQWVQPQPPATQSTPRGTRPRSEPGAKETPPPSLIYRTPELGQAAAASGPMPPPSAVVTGAFVPPGSPQPRAANPGSASGRPPSPPRPPGFQEGTRPSTPEPQNSAPAPVEQRVERRGEQRGEQRVERRALPPQRGGSPSPGPSTPPPSKVTPLRQTPSRGSGESGRRELSQRQGGKPERSAPPRRRSRRTPRPVLYGLRLLILGVGMAAIAGTLLSTLNPTDQRNQATSAGEPSSPTPQAPPRQTLPEIPLGEQMTYLDAALTELQTLAPGLTQSTFALDLDTGRYSTVAGDQAFAAASLIKVPILVAYLAAVDQGRLTLAQGVTLSEATIVGGSGEMQFDEVGTRYAAYDVATQMIIASDNTATELMIELLGGASALNQQFQSWGLRHTVIRNPLPDLEGTNTTSPRDLVRLLALIDQGEILSQRSRDRLLAIMQRTYSRDLIPAGIAEGALVFNKTGDIGTLLGDVALVEAPNGKRYALAVLVERPHNDGRAAELIRRISEAVHQEMNQPLVPTGGSRPEASTDQPSTNTSPEESPEGEESTPGATIPPG